MDDGILCGVRAFHRGCCGGVNQPGERYLRWCGGQCLCLGRRPGLATVREDPDRGNLCLCSRDLRHHRGHHPVQLGGVPHGVIMGRGGDGVGELLCVGA